MTKKDTAGSVRRGELDELALLYEVSQLLDRSLDLGEVAAPLLDLISSHTGMRHGTLTLLNRQTGEASIQAAHGLSRTQKERGKYRQGEGVIGKVVQTGRPAVVPRVSDEPHFLDRTGARKRQSKRNVSFICVPIKVGKEVVGTLSADHLFAEQVALDEDLRLLTIITSMIAQAVKLRQAVEEERHRLQEENERLQGQLRERFRPDNIIGNSKAMQGVFDTIAQVAQSDATVLVRGESGTGKELVAHAIHHASRRVNKPYVKVNCAALPETILEAELFGHEKGAFTGAIARKKGRFELAQGGTLFLDEVGDFSPATQVKLLRVIQEREFELVGGIETRKADVRIIAATNRDLEELVAKGEFREDLYYRLNVFPVHLPPLRDRKSDILLLADSFVAKYSEANGKKVKRISTPAIDMMMAYHWPGNVRELENCIERAILLTNDSVIHGNHLPPTLQTAEASGTVIRETLSRAVERLEREMIIDTLKTVGGNCSRAADMLGVTERILGLRLSKYDIDYKRFRRSRAATD
jgi:Nif-specific regulatory protein